MNEEELRLEQRKQKRLESLGSNDPQCCACEESDWRTLELHHVAGCKHDDTLVAICRNCHRKVSDDQKDHPAFEPGADPMLSSIGHFLLGLADMLKLIFAKLHAFGLALIERASTQKGIVS
jgi:hypothetical protein